MDHDIKCGCKDLMCLYDLSYDELTKFHLMMISSMLKMRLLGYNALNRMYRDTWRIDIDVEVELNRKR